MEDEVVCFWLEPTDMVRVCLRRYRHHQKSACLSRKVPYCTATVPLTVVLNEGQHNGDLWPHSDDRWPNFCAYCGHPFEDNDNWLLDHQELYRRINGTEMTLREAPPGAMWDATWLEGAKPPGPDGRWLHVRLPDGRDWFIDGPAKSSDKPQAWDRTGVVPKITVRPSIKTPRYHGFLTEGVLRPAAPPPEG